MIVVYIARIIGTITPAPATSVGRTWVHLESEEDVFVREIPHSSKICDTWEEARAWLVSEHTEKAAQAYRDFRAAQDMLVQVEAFPEHETFELKEEV